MFFFSSIFVEIVVQVLETRDETDRSGVDGEHETEQKGVRKVDDGGEGPRDVRDVEIIIDY